MHVVHLTASTFFGGPERQMLGLADHSPSHTSTFVSFAEGGRCKEFLGEVRRRGHAAIALASDTPADRECVRELTRTL